MTEKDTADCKKEGQPPVVRRQEVYAVKIETIKEVKARLNRIVSDLPRNGSVIITRNGQPCAVLMPITKDTDLEIVALSQNKRFWSLYDSALEKANKQGWTSLNDA
jgi:antitoxin (DNA-binding transcriptional repressor) of toxin-antitoxin stability system